jgi:hypothetical protein
VTIFLPFPNSINNFKVNVKKANNLIVINSGSSVIIWGLLKYSFVIINDIWIVDDSNAKLKTE